MTKLLNIAFVIFLLLIAIEMVVALVAGQKRGYRILFAAMTIPLFGLFLAWFGMQIFMEKPKTSTEYSQTLSLSDYVEKSANQWLATINGGSDISISDYLAPEDLQVTITYILSESDELEGLVSPQDYEKCQASVKQSLVRSLEAIIQKRLLMAGITDSEEIDVLMVECFGIGLADYIELYGPELLPGKQDILYQYNQLEPVMDDVVSAKWNELLEDFMYGLLPAKVLADDEKSMPVNLALDVLGRDYLVKAYNVAYEGNYYISLRDFAKALEKNKKRLGLSITSDEISLWADTGYSEMGGENEPFSSEKLEPGYMEDTLPARYNFSLNGEKKICYTIKKKLGSGYYDCYMNLTDLALFCGFDFDIDLEKHRLTLKTETEYELGESRLTELAQEGYFSTVASALLGSIGEKDEILFAENADRPVEMASITKLMSIICIFDGIANQEISLSDVVTVSKKASDLSKSDDGYIELSEGSDYRIAELMEASLLASSNECTLVLAEALSGSEEAFVKRMNEKALQIGMSNNTCFYNCHGLPQYTNQVVASKLQNKTTAQDCFRMVCYLLRCYPQVLEITSQKSTELKGLGISVNNTNPLIYNMENCVGLKTGTTNQAGYCLVSALQISDGEQEALPQECDSYLIAMEFGAEDAATRNRMSQILLESGRVLLSEKRQMQSEESKEPEESSGAKESEEAEIPDNPENMIWELIRFCYQKQNADGKETLWQY